MLCFKFPVVADMGELRTLEWYSFLQEHIKKFVWTKCRKYSMEMQNKYIKPKISTILPI